MGNKQPKSPPQMPDPSSVYGTRQSPRVVQRKPFVPEEPVIQSPPEPLPDPSLEHVPNLVRREFIAFCKFIVFVFILLFLAIGGLYVLSGEAKSLEQKTPYSLSSILPNNQCDEVDISNLTQYDIPGLNSSILAFLSKEPDLSAACAPDFGIPLCYCVLSTRGGFLEMFNMEIIQRTGKRVSVEEMSHFCPGTSSFVTRYVEVKIMFGTAVGTVRKATLKNGAAYLAQQALDLSNAITPCKRKSR